jgi:hypothetical protein
MQFVGLCLFSARSCFCANHPGGLYLNRTLIFAAWPVLVSNLPPTVKITHSLLSTTTHCGSPYHCYQPYVSVCVCTAAVPRVNTLLELFSRILSLLLTDNICIEFFQFTPALRLPGTLVRILLPGTLLNQFVSDHTNPHCGIFFVCEILLLR